MMREASRSGWKTSRASYFSPDAHELHRLAGDLLDRKSRAAACIAVHLGQDEAVESESFVKLLGALDGVLPEHRVGDEQDLVRPDLVFDLGELLHELFVDVQSSRRIDQEDVVAGVSRFAQGAFAQSEGLIAGGSVPDLDVDVFRDDLQLLARRRPVNVHRDEHRAMVVFREPLGELSGGRRLAGALQADHHDDRWRLRREVQPDVLAAQDLDQLVMDDLDDLLPRAQALHHFLSERLLLHGIRELLHDLEVHVGFEQGDSDFLERLVEVLFADAAFALEVLENALQFFG